MSADSPGSANTGQQDHISNSAAVHPLHMPRPGRCHNAYCDEPTTHVVRYRRIRGGWATGIDYCEPHAHEAAQRMRENFKVVVEPT